MTLNVSAIQHFSTGDGPGIRTTVFLKGCNLRCPWCHNPETISKEKSELNYPHGLETNGSYMEIDDIISELLEDIDFYGDDGGVTVSGGEPMLQAESVAQLLEELKNKNIPVIIDTAGSVPYTKFEALGDGVHTYFFDLKAANEEDYIKIGGSFGLVTDNLKRLIASGKNVRVRIPLIPGFNTSEDYSEAMCEVLKGVGAAVLDLLPFHRLGLGKYKALGMDYAYSGTEPMNYGEAEKIASIYRRYFNVSIEK